MSIIKELNDRGININKTNRFLRGYYKTEKGTVVSMFEQYCEDGVYFLTGNNDRLFPCSDSVVYILSGTEYEGKIKTKEEAEALAQEGKILSFKGIDLYAEFYDFANNKELECCIKYRYSAKSREYIEEVMKSIGFINYTDVNNGSGDKEGEPTDFEVVTEYSTFTNNGTKVGKLEPDLWIAQTCYQIAADDYAVTKMYFDHEPQERELRTAFAIKRFASNPKEVFTCRKCGEIINWLEIAGDINDKLDMAEREYCGC